MVHFHLRHKGRISYNPQSSGFITFFFSNPVLTWNDLSFRLCKATTYKNNLKTDLLYRILYTHTIYSSITHNTPHSSSSRIINENHNSSTAHEFICCVLGLKQSRTSPHSPGPQPETLYGIGGARCSGCEPSSGVVDELLVLMLL